MTARSGDDGPEPVVLGKVGAPHGVQGWVKVFSFTDPPEGIMSYPSWDVALGTVVRRMTVLESKRAGQAIAVRFAGIESREAAQMFSGAEVRVDRSELPEPEPGTYYWRDLVGLAAFNREGEPLGSVADVVEMPAHPILVLAGERERLVPLVPDRLVAVDLAAGRVTLDWHVDD
jgi:16S rRNA processing protein RimM